MDAIGGIVDGRLAHAEDRVRRGQASVIRSRRSVLAALVLLAVSVSAAAEPALTKDDKPWEYKTQRLNRAQLDALLQHPERVLVIDVRRPDEVSQIGGFPVYLSIQVADVASHLAFIPKDRTIVTVSNRAHRAGAVGDLLAAKGFKVAGAIGTKDYEEQGGTAVVRLAIPPSPVGTEARKQ